MLTLERFRKAQLSVGHGENRFTMKRGSFSYAQRTEQTRRMKKLSVTDNENGFDVVFEDPKTGGHCTLVVRTGEEDAWRVRLAGDLSEEVNRFTLTFPTSAEEHIYGCGETHSEFDLKGQNVRIWVAEHQNARRIARKLIRQKLTSWAVGKREDHKQRFSGYESYYAQPTFVSSDCWFAHVFTDRYCEFDFSKPDVIRLRLQERPDLVIQSAEDFVALSERQSRLLGFQAELPDWLYDGVILAIQQGPDVIDRKLKECKKYGVKVCGVWSQDWCGCRRTGFGYQVMWNWEADPELYPDLKEHIAKWKKQGIRFLGYINPFLALEKPLYEYAAKHGYCVKDREGRDCLVKITTFPAAMVDLTNPKAWTWYKNIIKNNMIALGMGGWMADFGEYLPTDCVLASGEAAEDVHNRWPAMWARLNKEAVQESGADDVFFFTRAGHTGTVQYSPMMWTGDQHVDWSVDDGIPSVIPATLSLAMSGCGLTHSDVGGYTTVMHMRRDKELLMRWGEMNTFSVLARSHEGNQPGNNVQFDEDEEVMTELAAFARIHAGLKPYLKAMVKENAKHGTPVMRPLFFHYNEPACFTEQTEYLLGRDILVAPVLKPKAKTREVYLPDDSWIHLFTGKEYGGGKHRVPAPIGQPPVFIRKGGKYTEKLLHNKGEGE